MKTLIVIASSLLLVGCIAPQAQYQPIPSPTFNYKPQAKPQSYHVSPSGRYEGYQGGYDITPVP